MPFDSWHQYVSHFLKDQLMVGINSDPTNSEGALTTITLEEFIEYFPIQEAVGKHRKSIK